MVDRSRTRAESELLDGFKQTSLTELSEFVKSFDATFDVTAAAPVAVSAPSSARDEKVAADARSPEYVVVLGPSRGSKISVMNALRSASGVSVGEAAHLVRSAPIKLTSSAGKPAAARLRDAIERAGGHVIVYPVSPAAVAAHPGVGVADPEHRARQDAVEASLAVVAEEFTQFWDPSLFAAWVTAPNPYLANATPLIALAHGRFDEIRDAIEASALGEYI